MQSILPHQHQADKPQPTPKEMASWPPSGRCEGCGDEQRLSPKRLIDLTEAPPKPLTKFSAAELAEFGIEDTVPLNNDSAEKATDTEPSQLDAIPAPISAGLLMQECPELRPPVIDGIIRATETMNLISTSKAGKTYLALDLALSVCTGRAWLGRFTVTTGPALYLDAELHRETLARRLAAVASARGVVTSEFAAQLELLPMRGRLRDLYALDPIFRRAGHGRYRLIVIDALYRLLPRGTDENSNADMTALLNRIDQYADLTGAAIVIVHHATKGSQAAKGVTDVGSGAGAQSRAVDAHLILRPHQEDDAVVMEAAVRSFAPLSPLCLRWRYPTWTIADELDPAELRDGRPRRKIEAVQTPADQPKAWTPESFAQTFIAAEPRTAANILTLADAAKLSERRAARLLAVAVETGFAHEWTYADRRLPHRFANIAQPVTETVRPAENGEVRSRARTPHTPHGRVNAPRGKGNSRAKRRSSDNADGGEK